MYCHIQGHVICDDCYGHLLNTSRREVLCVTCGAGKYLVSRPVVLERVLGLLDEQILIE